MNPDQPRDAWRRKREATRDRLAKELWDCDIANADPDDVVARLLPVVAELVREGQAEALDEAAEQLRQHGVGPEVFVLDDRAAALRAGGAA